MAPHNIPADFDFLDASLNLERLPVEELAELRASEPVHWVDVPGGTGGFGDKGYWLVTKHADVKEVSKRNDIFGSSPDGAIPVWPQGMERSQIDLQKAVLLNMDAPQHTRLRKIISRGFTPRAVGRLEEELASRAQKIAATAAAEGSGDFVEQVSCELPLQAIAGLLGVPQDDRDKLFRWSNEMTAGEDPEYAHIDPAIGARPEPMSRGLEIDPRYLRREVAFDGPEEPGSIVIDTPNKFLYLVQPGRRAVRYGIGVGRPGFTWAGSHKITAKKEWPDWIPPEEMLQRQPDLPRFMPGGVENPLGARALYLGSTLYRIHGTNEAWTIGQNVSSGCIRMRNPDVIDLYERVKVGAKVVVL